MAEGLEGLGVVVIGRNEGERLATCLAALRRVEAAVVYVDSGSSDGSRELAREAGVDVVELDTSVPFTAARGRNAGFAHLMEHAGAPSRVQFVDGDCELAPGWLGAAMDRLDREAELAIVTGRLRERHPEASVYQRLCDMEWRGGGPGLVDACGGIFLVRSAAFAAVGGFAPDMEAGEEPELCLRLREAGWQIRRLDAEMGWHDAELLHFTAWWTRQVRAGGSCAENAWRHGRRHPDHYVRSCVSNLVYGGALPGLALLSAPWTAGLGLAALLPLALLYRRIAAQRVALGDPRSHAALYARYTVLGKGAQLIGMLRFAWRRLAAAA